MCWQYVNKSRKLLGRGLAVLTRAWAPAWFAALTMAALHVCSGAAVDPTLAQALLEDMLPPPSSRCVPPTGLSSSTTAYPGPSDGSGNSWYAPFRGFESDVFAAQLAHNDATNSNRSWQLRVAGVCTPCEGPLGRRCLLRITQTHPGLMRCSRQCLWTPIRTLPHWASPTSFTKRGRTRGRQSSRRHHFGPRRLPPTVTVARARSRPGASKRTCRRTLPAR